MNEIKHRWKDLLMKRNSRFFLGRDHIIEHFRLNCLDAVPRDLVIALHGVEGVGKSTTIKLLREVASEYNIFSTYVDSSITSSVGTKVILNLMRGIAQQFSANGIPLTQFDEFYYEYITALQQISADSEAPGAPLDIIGGLSDQDSWHKQSWDTYLNNSFSPRTSALLRQPVDQLTPVFLHDLNTWALVKRILLCFDDWHILEDWSGMWLRDLMLDGELSTRIWVLLAGREALSADWDPLDPVLITHELRELTELETRTYLRSKGIFDKRRISDIIAFSECLPVMVNMLSAAEKGIAGDLALSPLDRYFKWLTDEQRRVVLLGSVARYIDANVLDTVLGKDGEVWFEWLKHASLLDEYGDLWAYHPALRPQLLAWARREMYGATYAAHVALRAYYLASESPDESDLLSLDESTTAATLEAIYHGLMIAESGALRHAILTFVHLLRSDFPVAGDLVGIFQQASAAQENQNAVVEWTATLKELWDAFMGDEWKVASACCEDILAREAVDAEVKSAFVLLYKAIKARFPQPVLSSTGTTPVKRESVPDTTLNELTEQTESMGFAPDEIVAGEGTQAAKQVDIVSASSSHTMEEARSEPASVVQDQSQLSDLSGKAGESTHLDARLYQTAEQWIEHADACLQTGTYQEALAAYGRALELNPELTAPHFGRASAYTQMGDFASAMQCYDRILELDRDNVTALRNRGWLHMRQRNYSQALTDYDQAVHLAPDDVVLVCTRANVHYRLKDYANALRGYDDAIRLDATYTEAYLNRGITHAVLQEFRRAIADFNQAITLEPGNGYAYHRRGRAFARLQQFDQALKDYLTALELMPQLTGVFIDMGLIYTKQSDYQKALDAYLQAIERNPGNATAHYNAACVAGLMGNVDEACRRLDTAIELHPAYRQMAQTDVDFSSIRQSPAFQKRMKLN